MHYQTPYDCIHFWTFESLEELTTEVQKAFNAAAHTSWGRGRAERMREAQWVGRPINNLAHARELAERPWDQGLAIVERMLQQLQDHELPQPTNIRRRAAWSEDHGDEVCLDRLRSGQPYWRTTARQHRPGPATITVIANLGAVSELSTDSILWRGAAAICLTYILEQAGYRVELWGARLGSEAYSDKHHAAYAVKLKDAADPLDISSTINAVSGWFYRSTGIAAVALRGTERLVPRHAGGSGSVQLLADYITTDANRLIADWVWSEYAAVEWIKQSLQSFCPAPAPIEAEEVEARTDTEEVVEEAQSGEVEKPRKQKKTKTKRYDDA